MRLFRKRERYPQRKVCVGVRAVTLVVTAMMSASYTATPAQASECKPYNILLVDAALEAYSTQGQVDPAEVKAHKESIAWGPLFALNRCPATGLRRLSTDTAAAKKWISELPDALGLGTYLTASRRSLLTALRRRIESASVDSKAAEVKSVMLQALPTGESGSAQSSAASHNQWCGVLVEKLNRDWREPDGYLMAATNDTAVILPSCPEATLAFLGEHPHVGELWTANLEMAVFTRETRDEQRLGCVLAKDMMTAVRPWRTSSAFGRVAKETYQAVFEGSRYCRTNARSSSVPN